jgi:osmotically-inducible protein OsmY
VRRASFFVLPILLSLPAAASTLGDMDLRDNVEIAVRGNATTATLHLKIDVDDAVARPQGRVRNLAQADKVVELASKVRGIRAVDRSGLVFEHGDVPDDAIASAALRAIDRAPNLAAADIRIAVKDGVVTLTGSIEHAGDRQQIRDLLGVLDGVRDLVDRLDSPEAPDGTIQKVLDRLFSPRATPPFPGAVRATVIEGVVTLEGHVPRLYDRRIAERYAWAIDGVRRVEDRLDLSDSGGIQVIRP